MAVRALPAAGNLRPLWWAAAAALAGINALAVWASVGAMIHGTLHLDYLIFVEAAQRVWDGGLYAQEGFNGYVFRHSPLMAIAYAALPPLPIWLAAHVAVLVLLPWRIALLVLVSAPFWFDMHTGNLLVFVAVMAFFAYRGNRWAGWGFLIMTLLIPRPLMLPLAAWLLWHNPTWRVLFAGLLALSLAGAWATGWGAEWVGALAGAGPHEYANVHNISPSRLIGPAWIAIGVPLGAWLTWKGRLGWASFAVSPYLLPYYLLFGLLEVKRPAER